MTMTKTASLGVTEWIHVARFREILAGGLALGILGCGTKQTKADPGRKPQPALTAELWLDTLDLSQVEQDWGEPHAMTSVEGHPLRIGDRTFPRGIGTHAKSEFSMDLKGAAAAFEAEVGVDDEKRASTASVVFHVFADGRKVFDSGIMRGDAPAKPVRVDLKGAKLLKLVVTDADDGIAHDHADWAMARILLSPGAKEKPSPLLPIPPSPAVVLTPQPKPTPRINGPRVFGARPGSPFLYSIPATGREPLRFSAEGLPPGLTLDPVTGRITGSVKEGGTYRTRLSASNPLGEDRCPFDIVIGDTISLTPPLGWNSWYCWGTSVDDAKIRAAAAAMVLSGLAKHGWCYINVDDAWSGERAPDGSIRPNEKFPDMKALADYVHSKGLKFGLYTSPGPLTCAGYTGSFGHEAQDARSYAAWGVDYLKHDWCSCQSKDLKEPYRLMHLALDGCDRDIIYSLCQYGMGKVWEWGAEAGGNCWRTTGDIVDNWKSMSGIGFGQDAFAQHARPGHWNDPDMLVVGRVGLVWGPQLRPTRLSPDEQYTHVTLWSILAAPLLIGADLERLDPFTLGLLTNDEVLDVNQDLLGRQGHRVSKEGELEVWSKPLWDGTLAVAFFNRGRVPSEVTACWENLGLAGSKAVRDLWRQQDLGERKGSFTATVAPHGAVLVRVGSPKAN